MKAIKKKKIETKLTKKRTLYQKIINGFIVFLVFLLALFFGILFFIQTKTFRSYLKDKLVEEINKNINGKFSLGKIEGSLISSIILKEAKITFNEEEILYVKKLHLNYQPHNLLFKTIVINKFELDSLRFFLIRDQDSIWIFNKIFPARKDSIEKKNSQKLDYFVKIRDFKIRNCQIRYEDELNRSVEKKNIFSSLFVNNFDLSFSASLDFAQNDYNFFLENCSFRLEPDVFELKNFKFNLFANSNSFNLNDVLIETESNKWEFRLNAKSKYSFFDTTYVVDSILNNVSYELIGNLNNEYAGDFSFLFSDLDAIKQPLLLSFSINGLGKKLLVINYFNVKIGNSPLNFTGSVADISERVNYKLTLNSNNFYYSDIYKAFTVLKLPKFDDLKIDTLSCEISGNLKNINAFVYSKIGKGSLKIGAKSLFDKDTLITLDIFANSLNLKPIIKTPTELNLSFNGKIHSFNLDKLNAKFQLNSFGSRIGKYKLDTLEIFSNFENGNGAGNLLATSDSTRLKINYSLIFSKGTPQFFIEGESKKLSFGKLNENSNINDEFNFSFNLQGINFDLGKMQGVLNFYLDESKISDRTINPTQFQLILDKQQNRDIVSFRSEFLDARIIGDFNLQSLGENISKLVDGLIVLIERKKSNFYGDLSSSLYSYEKKNKVFYDFVKDYDNLKIETKTNAEYSIKFKNIQKAAYLLFGEEKKIDLLGEIYGRIYFDSLIFLAQNNGNIKRLKLDLSEEPILISNLNWNFYFNGLSNNFSERNIKAIFRLKNNYIYASNIIENTFCSINYENESFDIKFNTTIDSSIYSNISLKVDVSKPRIEAIIDTFNLNIGDRKWLIIEPTYIYYSFEGFQLSNFYLYSEPALFNLSCEISQNGKIDAFFFSDKIDGEFIRTLFLNLPKNYLTFNFRTGIRASGELSKPKISGEFDIEKLSYGGSFIGDIRSYFMYDRGAFVSELSAYNDYLNDKLPYFGIYLYAIADFAIYPFKFDRKDKDIIFEVGFNNFDLSKLSGILPGIQNLKGIANGNIAAKGGGSEIIYDGKFNITNASFKSSINNMSYSFSLNSVFKDNFISFEEIKIANLNGTKYPGSLNANGRIEFDGLNIKKISIKANGSLAVLNRSSQETLKFVYGDLTISTGGDVYFLYENNKSYLSGAVNIQKMDLVVPPLEQRGAERKNEFVYKFIDTLVDKSADEQLESETSIYRKIRKKKLDVELAKREEKSQFIYDLRIRTLENARVNIIISRQMNFRLRVEMDGDLTMENRGGVENIQGEFKLLEGSNLEFLKTFEAYGSIKFEKDLANPMLNITAFYQNEYFEPQDTLRINPIDVMVAVKLVGPLNEVMTSFANKKDNIVIYYGAQNIQNKVPDNTKDASDAISFVIAGKFKDDLTAADKSSISQSNLFSSAAVSILGSALSQFANAYLGDFVKNIELRQGARGDTRFNISGRYEKLRYTFGSAISSSNNADLTSEATFKLEYLFSPSFLLRLERKDPVAEKYGNMEKILELGIKYRYEF